MNQTTKITFPTVNGVRNTQNLKYDPNGNITSVTNSLLPNSILYGYYPSGQASTTTGANGQTATNTYDEEGRIAKTWVFDGTKSYNTYYQYGDTGLLDTMYQDDQNGTLLIRDTFAYDKSGDITQITHMDGSKEAYQYDLAGRLKNEKSYNSAGSVINDSFWSR